MEKEIRKQAVDLTDLAVGIVILGMVVSIGVTILVNVRDSRLTDLDVIDVANETITINSVLGTRFANRWFKSLTKCLNSSHSSAEDPEVILTGNYTELPLSWNGYGGINFTAASGGDYEDLAWNCTYDYYNVSRADWKLADEAATGIAEYGSWFKIIVIVGVASVVLALIFMAFGRRGDEGVSY